MLSRVKLLLEGISQDQELVIKELRMGSDRKVDCRCMAVSLAPHNIRVNAIGPGSIMTEVLQAVANNKKDMEK